LLPCKAFVRVLERYFLGKYPTGDLHIKKHFSLDEWSNPLIFLNRWQIRLPQLAV
jgi:hypothetical protein